MFRKYVLRLVWRVQIRPDGSTAVQDRGELSEAEAEEASFQAAITHLQSLADCLEVGLVLAMHPVYYHLSSRINLQGLHKTLKVYNLQCSVLLLHLHQLYAPL